MRPGSKSPRSWPVWNRPRSDDDPFDYEGSSFCANERPGGKLQGSLAALLNVKPIVLLESGLIDVTEKVRTRRRALERILEIMAERLGTSAPVNLAVVHADVPEEGQEMLDRAKALFNCRETFLSTLTTSLVVHFGPGTLGLIAYQV